MHTQEQVRRRGGGGEDCLATLIDQTNRIHNECSVTPWDYELTLQVHNIGIVAGETSNTLMVNPSWLRFVIESNDFEACVADEIGDWYLIQELTGMEYRYGRHQA